LIVGIKNACPLLPPPTPAYEDPGFDIRTDPDPRYGSVLASNVGGAAVYAYCNVLEFPELSFKTSP
jgi:hypothetical protein